MEIERLGRSDESGLCQPSKFFGRGDGGDFIRAGSRRAEMNEKIKKCIWRDGDLPAWAPFP
jgi:hypothetical protein